MYNRDKKKYLKNYEMIKAIKFDGSWQFQLVGRNGETLIGKLFTSTMTFGANQSEGPN